METNVCKSQRRGLKSVMDIIESTYPHDPETGERIDGDSPVSGADVVEALCSIEELVAEALANCDPAGFSPDFGTERRPRHGARDGHSD